MVVGFGPKRGSRSAAAGRPVLFTGPLEHRHLAHLWALADVSVTPSIFPEAFGMVAAEAAACGSPPLVARHSGLAEIAEGLRGRVPGRASRARLVRERDVDDLAAKLSAILALPADERRLLGPPRGARQSRSGAGPHSDSDTFAPWVTPKN